MWLIKKKKGDDFKPDSREDRKNKSHAESTRLPL
jgi:hypothetical protein